MDPIIGICLPGGGAAGCFQAGMLAAADETGLRDRALACASASVGSLNAALWLQGDTARLLKLWRSVRSRDVYRKTKIVKLCSDSFFSTAPLERLIAKFVNPDKLAQAGLDWYCQATDADTGEAVLARQTDPDIREMVLASAAIPVLFPEVRARGRWLSDGGCADNTPMNPLIDAGCNVIFVLHCHPRKPYKPRKYKLTRCAKAIDTVEMFFRGNQRHDLARIERINRDVAAGRRPDKQFIRVIEIAPSFDVGILDFNPSVAHKAILDGYNAALAAFNKWVEDNRC